MKYPEKTFSSKKLRFITGALLAMAGTSLSAQSILVNFFHSGSGTITDPVGWNHIGVSTPLDTPVSLVDSFGANTALTATVTQIFGGPSSASNAYTGGNFIAAATNNGLFGNDVDFAGVTAPNPTVVFSGLNPSLSYNFEVYGSRSGVSDNRSGVYSFTGLNTGSDILNASSNMTETAFVGGIQPDVNGDITFVLTKDISNDNGTGFVYIAAMEITAVPEPATYAAFVGLFACGLVIWRRRRN